MGQNGDVFSYYEDYEGREVILLHGLNITVAKLLNLTTAIVYYAK